MRFIPYHKIGTHTNIIVDGIETNNTILTLSHWPESGTPEALKADTSTEIVFRYLENPSFRVEAEAVSCNHFDEDGLLGVFALLHPEFAGNYRDILIDAAGAGDFGVYKSIEAARIAFTISAYAEKNTSPINPEIFALSYPEYCGEMYIHLSDILPDFIRDIHHYKPYWEAEDRKLEQSVTLFENGTFSIDQYPELDLTVVRMRDDFSECHPFAIHSRTPNTRVAYVGRKRFEFQYRYESWVQIVSRKVSRRVDLGGLADRLNLEEKSVGKWVFEGLNEVSPRLYFRGADPSSLNPESILERLMALFKDQSAMSG